MKKYIIGAGPGDPDLITVKGLKIFQSADVIIYTDSLVNEKLIVQAQPDAEIINTAGMHLEEIVNFIVDRVNEGKIVVRYIQGPCYVWGNDRTNVVLKKEEIGYEVIPGVSSVFASAAAVGAELTVPDLTQTLILTRAEGRTPVPEFEKLSDLASIMYDCPIFKCDVD